MAAAKKELALVKEMGYEQALEHNKAFWHAFWESSFLSYDDGTAESDYTENTYYISQYLLNCGGYGTKPFHFIDGVWKYGMDEEAHWERAYWHFNERAVYNGNFAGNHLKRMLPYFEFYLGLADTMKATTKREYGIEDAIKVSETIDWKGMGYDNEYTGKIMSTGSEIAINMFDYYAYTQDKAFLEKCYPFMKDVADFYLGYLKEEDGKYKIKDTNCKENWWNVDNAINDQAAIRSSFPNLIETIHILGKTEDKEYAEKLQDVLNRLEPIETGTAADGKTEIYRPYRYPEVTNNNVECPELELIWPMTLTGIGYPDYEKAKATFDNRTTKGLMIWSFTGIQAARLGLGDEADTILKQMMGRNQKFLNGICDDGNGKYESNGIHLTTMQEMYMQSYDGNIRVFPAVPSKESFCGKFTLLAKGGFLVSSEYENGSTKYIGLKSQLGGTAHIVNPWGKDTVKVNGKQVKTDESGIITIETQKDGVYIIERASSPLSGYAQAVIGGTANTDVKKNGKLQLGKGADEYAGDASPKTPGLLPIYQEGEKGQLLSFQNSAFDPKTQAYFELLEGPQNGVLQFYPDGSFTYTADSGFAGADAFTYQLVNREEKQQGVVTLCLKEPQEKEVIVARQDYSGKTGVVTPENSGGFDTLNPGNAVFEDGAIKISQSAAGGETTLVCNAIPETNTGKVYVDFQFKLKHATGVQVPSLFSLGLALDGEYLVNCADKLNSTQQEEASLTAESYQNGEDGTILTKEEWQTIRGNADFNTWQYVIDFDRGELSININGKPTMVQNIRIPYKNKRSFTNFTSKLVGLGNGSDTASLLIKDFEVYRLKDKSPITISQTDKGIVASACYENAADIESAGIITAAYQNGSLIDVRAKIVKNSGGLLAVTTEALSLPAGTYEIRTVLWNSRDGIIVLPQTDYVRALTVP